MKHYIITSKTTGMHIGKVTDLFGTLKFLMGHNCTVAAAVRAYKITIDRG